MTHPSIIDAYPPQFIIYRKADKAPIDPATMQPANAHDPARWLAGPAAWAYAKFLGPEYGAGFVITAASGVVCIDIDKALQNGQWSELSREICAMFPGAYREVSQGGAGLHLFMRSTALPPHASKNTLLHIELYSDVRFIGVTGTHAAGDPLFDATEQLPKLIDQYFKPRAEAAASEWTTTTRPGIVLPDDEMIIDRLLRDRRPAALFGHKIQIPALWQGDVTALARAFPPQSVGKTHDGSSADLALANAVVFVTGGNCDAAERIMRRSGLVRDKWERPGYLQGTILRAIEGKTEFFKWAPPAPPVEVVSTGLGPMPQPPAGPPQAAPAPPTVPGAPNVPPPPDAMPGTPKGPGDVVGLTGIEELFTGYTYVEDIYRIMTPDGYLLDKGRFDVRFPGREFMRRLDGTKSTESAWAAFTDSGIYAPSTVHETVFNPLAAPLAIDEVHGRRRLNVYAPVEVRAVPGDVSLFLDHLRILLPLDWPILLAYLKFMIQFRGIKAKFWPFIQGCPGNGKSYVSATMEYCVSERYTQRPTPKNMDSQFNASLYACLFVAFEDVKVHEDYGTIWETLKPMITEPRIEIQPKGVDKVTREICFNGIMNSNSKIGIRKERDDRRICPLFCAQQYKSDKARDGLTPEYFRKLWNWSKADGWAHVAHYLATDPIPDELNPAVGAIEAPITSSTAEAIRLSLPYVEQELINAVETNAPGFRYPWINGQAFNELLAHTGRNKAISQFQRPEILAGAGYRPHPALKDGRFSTPLTDGSRPIVYVHESAPEAKLTSITEIRKLFEMSLGE